MLSFTITVVPSNSRRKEPHFNEYQTRLLIQFLSTNQYPSKKEKEALAIKANLTEMQVKQWFERTRRKLKSIGRGSTIKSERILTFHNLAHANK